MKLETEVKTSISACRGMIEGECSSFSKPQQFTCSNIINLSQRGRLHEHSMNLSNSSPSGILGNSSKSSTDWKKNPKNIFHKFKSDTTVCNDKHFMRILMEACFLLWLCFTSCRFLACYKLACFMWNGFAAFLSPANWWLIIGLLPPERNNKLQ